MSTSASSRVQQQAADHRLLIDPAIAIWLIMAAAAAWQIGGSSAIRGLFPTLLTLAGLGLALAGSSRWPRFCRDRDYVCKG